MDGFYQLDLVAANANGEMATNVSFWEINGTDPTQDAYGTALDFAGAFKTVVLPSLRAVLSASVLVDFLKARKVDDPSGPYAKEYVQLVGLHTSGCTSFVLACDVRLKPGGIANRPGHWFIGGLSGTEMVSGRLTTPARTLVETFAATLIAPLTVGTGDAKIQTKTRYPSPTPPTYTPVTHYEVAIKLTGLNKRSLPVI